MANYVFKHGAEEHNFLDLGGNYLIDNQMYNRDFTAVDWSKKFRFSPNQYVGETGTVPHQLKDGTSTYRLKNINAQSYTGNFNSWRINPNMQALMPGGFTGFWDSTLGTTAGGRYYFTNEGQVLQTKLTTSEVTGQTTWFGAGAETDFIMEFDYFPVNLRHNVGSYQSQLLEFRSTTTSQSWYVQHDNPSTGVSPLKIFANNSGTPIATTTNVPVINKWNRVIIARVGATVTITLNGVVGFTGSPTFNKVTFDSIRVGHRIDNTVGNDSGTMGMTGYMDELEMWRGSVRDTVNFANRVLYLPFTSLTNESSGTASVITNTGVQLLNPTTARFSRSHRQTNANYSAMTLSNSGKTATASTADIYNIVTTNTIPDTETTKKLYAEISIDTTTATAGDANGQVFIEVIAGGNPVPSPASQRAGYSNTGRTFTTSAYVTGSPTYTTGDIIGVAVDTSTNLVSFYKNGALIYSKTITRLSQNIAVISGNGGVFTLRTSVSEITTMPAGYAAFDTLLDNTNFDNSPHPSQAGYFDGGNYLTVALSTDTSQFGAWSPKAVDHQISALRDKAWLVEYNASLTHKAVHVQPIDETTDAFYLYANFGHGITNTVTLGTPFRTFATNSAIIRVTKNDWIATVLTPTADTNPTHSFAFGHLHYLGKDSVTGFHLFVRTPKGLNATSTANPTHLPARYYTLNPAAGTLTIQSATGGRWLHQNASVPYWVVPTNFVPEDPYNYRWYYPSGGALVGDATIIYRQMLPIADITTPTTSVPALAATVGTDVNTTACTLSGMPVGLTLVNPSQAPQAVSGAEFIADSQIHLEYMKDGTDEYVMVFNLTLDTATNSTATQFLDMNTPPSRQRFYLFKIDPTNSANLIYVQHLAQFAVLGYYWGLTFSTDRKTAIINSETNFFPLVWNSTSKMFDVGRTVAVGDLINVCTIDSARQVYIETAKKEIYRYHQDSSYIATGQFQNIATVQNSTFPATINYQVDVYALKGTRASKSVTLTINSGDAVFVSNSQKTVTVNSSALGTTLVPVRVSSPSGVNITPQLAS